MRACAGPGGVILLVLAVIVVLYQVITGRGAG